SSDKVFQQAEAEYRGQQVLVSSLAEKLKLAAISPRSITATKISRSVNIYSPINGFVSEVNVNIGQYVSPTEVLFELVNPTNVHLALKVYEKDLDKLYTGQKLIAYTNNSPAKKLTASISLIGHDLSAERSADVHCHLETYDKTLAPGTYMNAEVQIKSTVTMAIPSAGVVQYEGRQFVFLSKNEKTFKMIEVNAGENDNGYTAVSLPEKSNLKNEQFVLNGAYSLLMMMKNKEM
ncbi:MAG TPA: efflux RND transporter periplasmic adaptor subunit, partial [Sphingobacteriaceae bacterium]